MLFLGYGRRRGTKSKIPKILFVSKFYLYQNFIWKFLPYIDRLHNF